jgi:biopolymer transport protein ExbD
MMCKKNSSRWAAAKALLVLPVVAISLSAFATTVYVPREVQDKVTENSVNDKEYKPAIIEIKGSEIYLNNKQVTAAELEAVIEEYRLQTLIYDENDAASKRTYEAIHNTLKLNGNIDAIYSDGKRPEVSVVRISGNKIYLNDEQVTIEQLKAKADENPATLINLQADANTSMGMVADVKNAFRSTTHAVKVNYYKEDKPQPIHIVNGKVIPIEDVNKIDPNTIKSVNVFKSYKEEFSKYDITEELAKNGVVVIVLKKDGEINAAQSETKSADIKVVGYSTREKDSTQQQDQPFIKVEKMPTFQGGDLNAFRNWMQGQIQ